MLKLCDELRAGVGKIIPLAAARLLAQGGKVALHTVGLVVVQEHAVDRLAAVPLLGCQLHGVIRAVKIAALRVRARKAQCVQRLCDRAADIAARPDAKAQTQRENEQRDEQMLHDAASFRMAR